MKTRNTLARSLGLLITVACANQLAIAAPPTRPSPEAVFLTGWLHVEDLTMADVVVTVEVNGVTRTGSVKENGRFDIVLPSDAEVLLRFEKPGHLPKEVTVDTRNVNDGGFADQRIRHIKFAVVLNLERHMAGLTYGGPVGSIAFDAGGGCLAVAHDRTIIPAKRQAIMVF
ncbi:MAG: hypothetical protein IPP83_07345 [Flavobacteriales bacterium]|nr:hypothetical protein [Flavobacteriales bacterium]